MDSHATAEMAEAAVRSLEDQAAYHKRERDRHRRLNIDAMQKLSRVRQQCADHGIIFEAEADSHGRHDTST